MSFDPFSSFGPSLNDLFQTCRRFSGVARPPKPLEPPSEEVALSPDTAAEHRASDLLKDDTVVDGSWRR